MSKIGEIITQLENCAVTGTPGLAGWKRRQVRELAAQIVAAAIPPGMTAEKLEKVADYVELLDRMDFDLEAHKVTVGPARTDETDMQDDLRAWAQHLRDNGKEAT